jgi:hypothetical protein
MLVYWRLLALIDMKFALGLCSLQPTARPLPPASYFGAMRRAPSMRIVSPLM